MRAAIRIRQDEADRLKAEAEALKTKPGSRISIYGKWRRRKRTKRGPRPIPT